jgi:hypothetical protein
MALYSSLEWLSAERGRLSNMDPDSGQLLDQLKFLREEAEANRVAQREEASANRQLLTDALKIVSYPLTAVLVIVGFLGWHDLNTLKQTIRQEAQNEAQAESKKMDKQVADTLAFQFQQENIQKTIKDAAVVAARTEAKPLIEAGVKREIGTAVAAQSGMIRSIATQAVSSKVEDTLTPLTRTVQASAASLHVQAVAARANADDSKAFDELLALRSTAGSDKELVEAAIAERYRHVDDRNMYIGTWTKCTEPDSPAVRSLLFANSLEERKQGLANCAGWEDFPGMTPPEMKQPLIDIQSQIAPLLVRIAENDPSLFMRKEAITTLNMMFAGAPGFPKKGLDPLDTRELVRWWDANGAERRNLLLIADTKRPVSANITRVDLYFQIREANAHTSGPLKPYLEKTIKEMEDSARISNERAAAEVGRSASPSFCVPMTEHLIDAMQRGVVNAPSVDELQGLRNCPANKALLPLIEKFRDNTNYLFLRYGATQLLNTWQHTSENPFERVQQKR